MKLIRILITIKILLVILASCSSNEELISISIKVQNSIINIYLKEVQFENEQTRIYGQVTFSPDTINKIHSFNLNCIRLRVKGNNSNDVFVDSFVHYITEDLRPTPNGRISFPVYWTFEGINLDNINTLKEVDVVKGHSKSEKNCITYK